MRRLSIDIKKKERKCQFILLYFTEIQVDTDRRNNDENEIALIRQ